MLFRYLSLSLSVCVGFYLLTPVTMVCVFQGYPLMFYIIPGREIPKWFEEMKICYTLPSSQWCNQSPVTVIKVKLQLPLVGDNPRGVVFCLLFLPTKRDDKYKRRRIIDMNGCPMSSSLSRYEDSIWFFFLSENVGELTCGYYLSEYGEVESHHLWLGKLSFYLPETPGCSIDKNGFHQVELEIDTQGMQVEKMGFRVV